MSENVRKVEVLGPGCARCKQTFQVVKAAVEEAGLAAEVEKIESLPRMLELGILATPAIAIDGRVVLSGRVPKIAEVLELLGSPARAGV